MGNLGDYQGIVVAAKEAGGVDKLIGRIEEDAVSRAAPGIFVAGALVGVALGAAATRVAPMAWERYVDKKKAREALAEDAKAQLKAAVAASPGGEGAGPGSGEDAEG